MPGRLTAFGARGHVMRSEHFRSRTAYQQPERQIVQRSKRWAFQAVNRLTFQTTS